MGATAPSTWAQPSQAQTGPSLVEAQGTGVRFVKAVIRGFTGHIT